MESTHPESARAHPVSPASPPPDIEVPPDKLKRMIELYQQGLMMQAWAVAREIGPLPTWGGTEARTWAGRLAANLGGRRLAAVLYWRAWRRDRTSARACAYHATGVIDRQGPLAGLRFLEAAGEPEGDPDSLLYLFTLRARTFSYYRDFESADHWLKRAREIEPDNAWLATEEAFLFERKDRYSEALEAIDRALELRPWYRPAVGSKAHFLRLMDRDEDALQLLEEAVTRLECGDVVLQLGGLRREMGQFEKARDSFEEYLELSPLIPKADLKQLNHTRVTMACNCGELKRARELALTIDEPYYKELAERISSGSSPAKKVRLKVPFIRQHHMTCAPATLSAISRFWNRPAQHLELAEAICYDGTPAQSERNWAEQYGWIVREFTVTWEMAVTLLDRGLPFTVTTSEATSGHLQAVVGYDALRATLLIRDPYVYNFSEVIADKFLESYEATGPRGMLMVPESRGEILEGLELPDASLYDRFYEVQRALDLHDREGATGVLKQMQSEAPDHRLTLTAQRAVASYDSNTPAMVKCLDALLKKFPKNSNLNLARLSCMREVGRREDRLKVLEELCEQDEADPVFFQQYAIELRPDARERSLATYWLDRALRYQPLNAAALDVSASMLWDERRFAEATFRYHLAACLEDKNEQYANSFFIASRHLNQTEEAMRFIQQRWERLGHQSAQPGITLFECLSHLGRTSDAFAILERALEKRPDDGDLALFAADAHARYGKFEEAARYLEKAQGRTRQTSWLRLAARLAAYRSDRGAALKLWREVQAIEPLAQDANREVALLLAETEGSAAALRFLEEVCKRFPYNCALQSLRVDWLKEEPLDRLEPALRELIAINPADAWSHRELALALCSTGRIEEGIECAGRAISLDPNSPYGYCTRGELWASSGRKEKAKADFRKAITLEVDVGFAIRRLVDCCDTLAERKEVLDLVEAELVRQPVFGDGLFAYREAASGVLDPDSALALCRRALEARPDLWAAWTVVILQLTDLGKNDEALELAKQANEKFPLLPVPWMARARVHQARLETDEQIETLEKALEISPAFSEAARRLAGAHERSGDFEKTRVILESACARDPLSAMNQRLLGLILWRLDRKEEALERVQKAVRLDPGEAGAWSLIHEWASELKKPTLAVDLIRTLTVERAGEARSWLLLADVLDEEEDTDELLSALDKALQLNPRSEEAFDRRALAFARLNRFDEAVACCQPAVFEKPPAKLQARLAWIDAHRGNVARAITTMEKVLEETPTLPGGWEMLTGWYWNTGARGSAVKAAENMARLDPFNPVPLGYAGDLKRRNGDLPGAIEDLQHAFQLDPSYSFAGLSLFDLQVERSNFKDATETLEVLERHVPGELVRARRGQLRALEGDIDGAFEVLEQLCTEETNDDWALEMLINTLEEKGYYTAVDKLIKKSLPQPTANPSLGAIWVQRQVRRSKWFIIRKLNRLHERGEIGRRAVIAYLELISERHQTLKANADVTGPPKLRFLFGRLMRHHEEWMRNDDLAWGKVGYALANMGKPTEVCRWLSDWKTRHDVEAWMLYNLSVALQTVGDEAGALEVIRHGNAMAHTDNSVYQTFKVWSMYEEAMAGNLAEARESEAELDPEAIEEFWKPLHGFAEVILEVKETPAPERKGLWSGLRRKIIRALNNVLPVNCDKLIRKQYRRLMRELGTDLDSVWPRLWSVWHYRSSTWIALAVIAGFVAFIIFATLAM